MNISIVLPILVMGVGFYLLVRLRFFFVLHPRKTLRSFVCALKKPGAVRSLCLALAGTLGVGNIFGVGAGIMIGGAGSLFWLLVSAVFSMVIKYAEALLSLDSLASGSSGMHRVIRGAFPRVGRGLSHLYCLICILLAIFMGAAMQSSAVATCAESALGIGEGITLAILVALVIFGVAWGDGVIEKITSYTVPVTTVIYILMSFSVIFLKISSLPGVLALVLYSAFTPAAAGGGILSFLFSRAISEGFARGVLSNEAGCGTSSFAHTRSRESTPHEAGLFGMCEVFFDTVILCPLTALVILLSSCDISACARPMDLVCSAFTSSLGEWAGIVLLFCIFSFAYSTVVCWFSYGAECTEYLVGKRTKGFGVAFFLFVLFGARLDGRLVLSLTDAAVLLLSVLTLLTIVKRREKIRELSLSGSSL